MSTGRCVISTGRFKNRPVVTGRYAPKPVDIRLFWDFSKRPVFRPVDVPYRPVERPYRPVDMPYRPVDMTCHFRVVQENGLDAESSDDDEEDVGARVFYSRCRLNGVEIRTVMMEEKKKTRDSVVCGRYTVNGGDRDTYFFGEVRHIASCRGNIFFCVEWFKNGRLTHDQMSGLHTIPVSLGPQDQMWIDAGSIVMQQHILIRSHPSDTDLLVYIKI